MKHLTLLVLLMTIQGLAKVEDWERFNSSLCIEVTRPNGVFTCTGVAVSPEIVITAAHCLEGPVKNVRIFTHETYDPKLTALEIANYKLHPNYNPAKSRYHSDIAKITMKEKLPEFITIYPIQRTPNIIGQILRFGFGGREQKNIRTAVTPSFRKINLKEEVIELNDEFSRSGDSGGPIYVQSGKEISLLAIHSTFSHGPEGNFSINPLLSAYRPWIFSH